MCRSSAALMCWSQPRRRGSSCSLILTTDSGPCFVLIIGPLVRLQFIVISIITAADAIDHLAKHKTPDDSTAILVLSVVSIVVLTAMGIYKLYLNK